MSTPDASPALKELLNAARMEHIARELTAVAPAADAKRFLAASLDGLDALSVMQRVRRIADSLHLALPGSYAKRLDVLRALAPRTGHAFAGMALCDYVALHGQHDFDASMAALKDLTPYSTAEFAVRHFLKRDLHRTLAVMQAWSLDKNEHVRRLASEGCRPRLPWSFRIEALVADPSPLEPILNNLKADSSQYVRKSVANCINDITKDHPDHALRIIGGWPMDDERTQWIARHALRSLVKLGDKRALKIVGADDAAEVQLSSLILTPQRVRLGGEIAISFTLQSTVARSQRLVVDYRMHYARRTAKSAAKVFKLKTFTLEAGASVRIVKRQAMRDFSTRTHHAGLHGVEILVNGQVAGRVTFDLLD